MISQSEPARAGGAEWNAAVARELGVEATVSDDTCVAEIDKLSSHVRDGVHTTVTPMTAFLVGVAAGRADDPAVAARDYVQKVSHMANGWTADEERGEPANDQSARG